MIQRIKNLVLFLNNLLVCFFLISCSEKIDKKIQWVNLANVPTGTKIQFGYVEENRTTFNVNLFCTMTKNIHLTEDCKLYSVSHSSDFLLKVYPENKASSIFELYLFPNWNVIEKDDEYTVKEIQSISAYFIEAYDKKIEKNYYIFSKDNKIQKPKVIINKNFDLEEVIKNLDSDIGIYNNDEQVLSIPYNGYVMKSNIDGNYVMLSTLWDH